MFGGALMWCSGRRGRQRLRLGHLEDTFSLGAHRASVVAGSLAALTVGLGLVWALVVENLLRGVGQLLDWVETLTTLLPGTAAGSLVGSFGGVASDGEGTPGVLDTVAGPQAAITVACYIALAAVTTLVVVRRRDVA